MLQTILLKVEKQKKHFLWHIVLSNVNNLYVYKRSIEILRKLYLELNT